MTRRTKKRKLGFTLVEIVLVVGILAVLSAIAIVALNIRGNTSNAQNVRRISDLENIQKALDLRAQDTSQPLPTNLPVQPICIGNGGSATLTANTIQWSQGLRSPSNSFSFSVRSCDAGSSGTTCNNPSAWVGPFTNPTIANPIIGLADVPAFQYQATFVDNLYPTGVTVRESTIQEGCTGTLATDTCFGSLRTWNTAKRRDLVAANEIEVAKIVGSWLNPDPNISSSRLDISTSWTTDATHFIRIYTASDARHSGVWDNTKYRIVTSGGGIFLGKAYTYIDGLQVQFNTGSSSYIYGIEADQTISSGAVYVSNNIINGSGYGGGTGIANRNGSIVKLKAWNNIIYDTGNGMIAYNSELYNNTVYNAITSFWVGNQAQILVNNISQNSPNGFLLNSGSWLANNVHHNIADTASSPLPTGGSGQNKNNVSNVQFVDAANKDFRLSSSDAVAKDAGYDSSSDSFVPFGNDIQGNIRPGGAAWDIGASETDVVLTGYDFLLKDVTLKVNVTSLGSDLTYLYSTYNDFKNGSLPSPLSAITSTKATDAELGAVVNTGSGTSPVYTSPVISGACYNLYNDLSDYLGSIPKDPKTGTDANTNYFIWSDPISSRVCLKAPAAENNEVIENCR